MSVGKLMSRLGKPNKRIASVALAVVFLVLFATLLHHRSAIPELASRAKNKLIGSPLDSANPWTWYYDRKNDKCVPTEVEDNRKIWNRPVGNANTVDANHWQGAAKDFNNLVFKDTLPMGIRDGDRVFEAGCGSGAFLMEIAKLYEVTVDGSDFGEELVEIAKQNFPNGKFGVADVQDLSQVAETEAYDATLSHGVWYYLSTPENAEAALKELLRITKPGGSIYVGDLDDPLQIAAQGRFCGGEGGFKLEKKWWIDMAKKHDFIVHAVVDGKDTVAKHWPNSGHRYNVYLRKPYPKRKTPCHGYLDVFC
ncbi:S-adenosyl-L-methionine-dependent methyltransferase [Powellomyces hirtus]|nr:S-adenosyl-L-methionine-dependent methyltransferase [Powellomyces hirtus]